MNLKGVCFQDVVNKTISVDAELLSDGRQCWLGTANGGEEKAVLLEHDDLFGILGRQTSALVGGDFLLALQVTIRGRVRECSEEGFRWCMFDISSLVIHGRDGPQIVSLEASDEDGEIDFM